ncbi:MAG: hypothetical protein Q9204_005953 [Flavoplaca sp. TL-2023a]
MSESGSDDEPIRPCKRRRQVQAVSSPHIDDEDYPSQPDPSPVLESPKANKENEDPETPKEAKKPKYRIHVPSKPDMPEDTFLTQPPSRSPSPYRIDKFRWRKPGRPNSPSSHLQHWQVAATARFPGSEDGVRQLPLVPRLSNPVEQTLQTHQPPPDSRQQQLLTSTPTTFQGNYDDLLDDLPSDTFSSPEPPKRADLNQPIEISSQDTNSQLGPSQLQRLTRLAAPIANLRQTTLFGDQASESSTQTQSVRKRNWPLANKEEPPTHHRIDRQAMETWVYPTNLGKTRDYQYSIVRSGLYHNMLVALPTGLGKTFIAATIMLNWFRWTTDAQIVFVAPTRPLVAQQIKACFEIAGIPRHTTTMLTGNTPPGTRAEEWLAKRVFFMTPQTIVNDLKTGICDPKRLVLLVVDEAHRATGGYAYVEAVQFLRRFNTSFRVLALTATPGSSIESVQEVIDGLGISRIEIRTEESLDIREYVHSRKVETVLFEPTDEMVMIMGLFAKALQPLVDKLCGMNAYWGKDPMTLTAYGCTQARSRWMSSDAGRKASFPIKGMVNQIFSLLASLAHGIELLTFHGIGPFYRKVLAFRDAIEGEGGGKVSKYRQQINDSQAFRTMMSRVQTWINNPDFVGHPKLAYLQRVVLNHFLDAGEGRGASAPSGTRIMVFAHYRDSAEEIARVLKRNEPMIRPRVFVGQANSKGSEGMDQKTQLDVIQKFQNGIFNTLVATSIGEEGLDIGEVDLIVCYDASASPIRMLQRMGRTGRKRAGSIVVTLMKGKEENNFVKAKDNYEKMQHEIASGVRFDFREDQSHRIVPREIQPIIDKKVVDIPIENTQSDLPEPSRRSKAPKRPPKKFHMPDGVRTGFVRASKVGEQSTEDESDNTRHEREARIESPEPLTALEEVLLDPSEQRELERRYQDVQGDHPRFVEYPRLDIFPIMQREHRPTKRVGHGPFTSHMIGALRAMSGLKGESYVKDRYERHLHPDDRREVVFQVQRRSHLLGLLDGSQSGVNSSIQAEAEDVGTTHSDDRPEDSLQLCLQSPPTIPDNNFYRPTSTASGTLSGSEEDLPDCSTLIQKQVRASSGSLFGGKNGQVARLRKRRKIIVDDNDSDE